MMPADMILGDVMGRLEALRDRLRDMPTEPFQPHLQERWEEFFTGVAYTCKIGMEDNLTPADYPMIRIVPSLSQPGATLGRRKTDAMIYFGLPIHAFDDTPDSAGRVRLEKLYAALLTMEAAICAQVDHAGGQYVETIFDEDRIDASYKLMAVRAVIHG